MPGWLTQPAQRQDAPVADLGSDTVVSVGVFSRTQFDFLQGLERDQHRRYARSMSSALTIQIWSDIACPWCYLGKHRLDEALSRFPHREAVRVEWRAFELDRGAPAVYPPRPDYAERLASKYRMPVERARQVIDEMTARGAREQVHFDFSTVRGVNTFAAHQVSAFAGQVRPELQHALAERFFRAYFGEGRVLSDAETLVELAASVGLDEALVRASLDGETFATQARTEERQAAELGVTGVPFFLIGKYAVEGAQPPDLLLRVLQQAWDEAEHEPTPIEEGASCGVDGC